MRNNGNWYKKRSTLCRKSAGKYSDCFFPINLNRKKSPLCWKYHKKRWKPILLPAIRKYMLIWRKGIDLWNIIYIQLTFIPTGKMSNVSKCYFNLCLERLYQQGMELMNFTVFSEGLGLSNRMLYNKITEQIDNIYLYIISIYFTNQIFPLLITLYFLTFSQTLQR